MKNSLQISLAIGILWCGASIGLAADPPAWEAAAKLQETAMSALRGGRHKEAEGLFETFVIRYGSHELAPQDYMNLAACCQSIKDANGWLDATDTVIKKFKGSQHWFDAYWNKLAWLRASDKKDEYLDLVEQFAADCNKRIPFRYGSAAAVDWYDCPREAHYPVAARWLGWASFPLAAGDWETHILWAADTPERAQKALAILAPMLQDRKEDLPVNWQVAHAVLLKRSGAPEDARTALMNYANAWAADPRGIALWTTWAARCQEANDVDGVDGANQEMICRYMGYVSLSEVLAWRLGALQSAKRFDEANKLGDLYRKTYPYGPGMALLAEVKPDPLASLRAAAVAGDANAIAQIEQSLQVRYPQDPVVRADYMVQLHVARKDLAKAAAAARVLLEDEHWCSGTYNLLCNYAVSGGPLAALRDEAHKKYGIYPAAPNGPAAALLAQLKDRIKSEQVRHMDEIAEKLLADHAQTAEAAQALQMLYMYYYDKVLPAPRQQWMDRLLNVFPRHPVTEAVLMHYLLPLQGGVTTLDYKGLGTALDEIHTRFPRAYPPLWWGPRRLMCYRGAGDEAGAKPLAEQLDRESQTRAAERLAAITEQALKGDVMALDAMAAADANFVAPKAKPAPCGDFWMTWADNLKDTPGELFCLRKAWLNYLSWVKPDTGAEYDKALAAVRRLQRSGDPEMQWVLEFSDISLMLSQAAAVNPKMVDANRADAALKALDQRLAKRTFRDLALRLSFGGLVDALGGDRRYLPKLAELATRLGKACPSAIDKLHVKLMTARVHALAGDPQEAVKIYMALVDDWPSAWNCSPWYQSAYQIAITQGAPSALAVIEQYLKKVDSCQDVVPAVLLAGAQISLANRLPSFESYRNRIVTRYATSQARGALEVLLAKQPKK